MVKKFSLYILFGFFVFGSFSFAQSTNSNSTTTITKCATGSTIYTKSDKSQACCEGPVGKNTSVTPAVDICCENTKKFDTTKNKCVCDQTKTCCGVKLNTKVPFIGNCISLSNKPGSGGPNNNTTTLTEQTAFPTLMMGLTKILVTVILLSSFVAIIVAGVMIASSGGDDTNASTGRKLIGSVVAALALLGASGVILRLINPNFFG